NKEESCTGAATALATVAGAVSSAANQPHLGSVVENILDTLRHSTDRLRPLTSAAELVAAVDAIAAWVARDVAKEARDRLFERRPDFLKFDDDARDLRGEYDLAAIDLSNAPQALLNLAAFADLDLATLRGAIESDNSASKDTQLRKANRVLGEKFGATWKQSEVAVSVRLEETRLRVVIEEGLDDVSPFDERSTGLRMFVSLACFLAGRDLAARPILLIDEAETHLHIDAQADLVRAFEEEQQVAKIIYTTHSPACLPSDLGTGVRAVLPEQHPNQSRSRVTNNLWHGGGKIGFSPILLAMGAATSAFFGTRHVVLAEGHSETILLPTL